MELKGFEAPDADVLIAGALQVNGRASWESISRAVDLPSRTVMRRGLLLLETGKVRVSTFIDSSKLLNARGVLIRLKTELNLVSAVAGAIAALPDASSVSILEGSGDICALVLVDDAESHKDLLLRTLPGIHGVQSFEVGTILRTYRMGLDWHAGILTPAQVDGLSRTLPKPDPDLVTTPVVLDEVDQHLVQLLREDGRATIAMLAQRSDINTQTVRRRLDALFSVGVLKVRTEVAPDFFRFNVEALIWLQIHGGDIESVGSLLAAHPSVRYCAAVTGSSGFLVDGLFREEEDLFDFQNEVIGSLKAVEIVESRIVLKAVRRGPMYLD